MGIRGHVRVMQPEYGKSVISSYISRGLYRYLVSKGVEIWGDEDGDMWEIPVTKLLIGLNMCLLDKGLSEEFDRFMPNDMRGHGICHEVGLFLKEGMDAAMLNGDDFITIEWY